MILFSLVMLSVYAQEEKPSFTDEELTNYATVMVWVEGEKDRMKNAYNGWIQENDSIEAAKFSEMLKASKAGTLADLEASEEETAAFNSIEEKNKEQQAAFKEVFVAKLKEDVSISLYNKLNKALKSDGELKTRYQTIFDELLAAAVPEEETEEVTEEDS